MNDIEVQWWILSVVQKDRKKYGIKLKRKRRQLNDQKCIRLQRRTINSWASRNFFFSFRSSGPTWPYLQLNDNNKHKNVLLFIWHKKKIRNWSEWTWYNFHLKSYSSQKHFKFMFLTHFMKVISYWFFE